VTDRRAHDPFAPHPRRAAVPAPPPRPPRVVPKGLDDMRKVALVALADAWGLDTSGTRPELISRIRGAA
jgi:hypothetical protein